MRQIVVLTLALLFALSLSTVAMAGTEAGQNEFSLSASYTRWSADGSDFNVLIAGIGYGYFITDASQIGGTFLGMQTSNGDTDTNLLLDLYYKYHFTSPGQTTVPYLGVQVGNIWYEWGGYDDTILSYGAMAGIKFFITENTTFFTELNYRVYDVSGAEDLDIDQTSLLFGLSYYF